MSTVCQHDTRIAGDALPEIGEDRSFFGTLLDGT